MGDKNQERDSRAQKVDTAIFFVALVMVTPVSVLLARIITSGPGQDPVMFGICVVLFSLVTFVHVRRRARRARRAEAQPAPQQRTVDPRD